MTVITGTQDRYPYPAGHTRAELRREVARYFGHHSFTATGGSTSSVIDAALVRFAHDYFVGANVYIAQADGAAPQGEDSYCTAFTASTGTLTCSPVFTAAVAAGDSVEVYLTVPKADVDAALARVGYGARVLHSLTPSTTTVDYSLDGIQDLHATSQVRAVWRRPGNDARYQPTRLTGWQLVDDAGVLTLRLPGTLTTSDGLWLEYLSGEDALQFDDDRLNLPTELVVARAVVWLLQNVVVPRQDLTGQQHYGTLLRDMRDVVTRNERQRPQEAGQVRGVVWNRGRARDGADALGLTENYGNSFANFP